MIVQAATQRHVDAGSGIPVREPAKSAGPSLDVDPEWVAERAAKRPGPPLPKKRGPIAGVIVALLVIAIVGVGVYVMLDRKPKPPVSTIAGPGVTIRITSNDVVKVSIDGAYAGTTPLSLEMSKGTKLILITAPGMTPQQVVPDRDQVVHLSPP